MEQYVLLMKIIVSALFYLEFTLLLNSLEKGYKIYLHTGRHINNFDVTINWLKKNKIDYDHIVFGKPVAKYYIDDRGINFTNWERCNKKMKL